MNGERLAKKKTQKIYSTAFNPLTDHMCEDTLVVLVFVLSKVQTLKHKSFRVLNQQAITACLRNL